MARWFNIAWRLLFCLSLGGCASITLNAVQDGRLVVGGPLSGVELSRQGVRSPVHDNMGLQPGDELQTDSQTIAVLSFMDGARVFVQPATRIRVGSIFVYFGEVLVKVKGYFQVDTKYTTAGSEGTQYLVRAYRADQVRVVVAEGRVALLSRAQRWRKTVLGPGEGAWMIGTAPPDFEREPVGADEITDLRRRIHDLDALVPWPRSAGPALGGAIAIGAGIGFGHWLRDDHKDEQPERSSGDGRKPPGRLPSPPDALPIGVKQKPPVEQSDRLR
ncbi:MAG: FecR domain-containing protein [Candidatus Accumulibacter sp.]|uniref:FecR family protein n=1 Tax=Accumulibacter sp. TaxID=2053492 RepID=UPI001A3E3A92|nr:FecR family protein [Accumulibacter sp.]MBL8396506.1 FecR domain-containing protein [Accumulibacter sp.]